jgi:hypothetical protein
MLVSVCVSACGKFGKTMPQMAEEEYEHEILDYGFERGTV